MSRSFLPYLTRSLLRLNAKPYEISRSFSISKIRRDDSDSKENSNVVVEKMEEFKVVCIGINRPSKRNCVNKATADQLYEAFSDFENDESLNCAVLHGM